MKRVMNSMVWLAAGFLAIMAAGGCGQSTATTSPASEAGSGTTTGSDTSLQSLPPASSSQKVALGGNCPVAYQMMHKAVPGKPEYSTVYHGKTYYFVKPEAKQAFLKDPQKYLPQNNGNCPVCTLKMNMTTPGDPKSFSVYKGKLYFFGSDKMKAMFDANPDQFVLPANAN